MLNSSFRIVRNLADAEDMVQEAFLDAFKNLERFSYRSSFEAWLKRIVINKSISLLRKRKINFFNFDDSIPDKTDDRDMQEEDFNYEVNRIKRAVNRLPQNQQIIFNLYAIDELPQEEIGKMMGLSHNNVRTLYHRARKKIIETLKQEVDEN